VHWMIYDLPTDTRRLPEAAPNRRNLSSGAEQGVNGAGGIGYTGPCPVYVTGIVSRSVRSNRFPGTRCL
jgi:phosphatidylethanolamine-binding protein (PEBP) family uncharacterized protein